MGADNYTKEEKEFYESIMREIRMHRDFGERNPVDIGIECGYSEDDVMKMIHMCQDIVEEEKMEAEEQKPEIPVRENWELEGIIPFEDFMKMDFPASMDFNPIDTDIITLMDIICDELGTSVCDMSRALRSCDALKKNTFSEYTKDMPRTLRDNIIRGFRGIVKWITCYGEAYNGLKNNLTIHDIVSRSMFPENAIGYMTNLVELEKKNNDFHPLNMMMLKQNGWDKETEPASDEHEEVKKGCRLVY